METALVAPDVASESEPGYVRVSDLPLAGQLDSETQAHD